MILLIEQMSGLKNFNGTVFGVRFIFSEGRILMCLQNQSVPKITVLFSGNFS